MNAKSQTKTLVIRKLNHEGRGVGTMDGKSTFIFGGLLGEIVSFQYDRHHAKYDEGHVTHVFTSATDRVIPRCPHFGVCAGCSLQHLSSDAQVKHKEKVLLEHFLHQAHTQPTTVLPPLQADTWHYRRKARLSVRYVPKKNKVLVGFREHHPRFVANLSQCETLHPQIGEKLSFLSDFLMTLQGKNDIAQIEVAVGDHLVAMIVRHLKPVSDYDLQLWTAFSNQHHYQLYFQAHGYETVQSIHNNFSTELLFYDLKKYHLRFYFHPTQFIQIHADMNEKMIALAMTLLNLNKNDTVLDLFCGIGNFSLPIAQQVKKVIGVEGSVSSVAQAKQNAFYNRIHHAEFYKQDLTLPLDSLPWTQQQFDKVILDPPRTGCREILPYFSIWKPSHLVYVSCNPITLARDAKSLLNLGYRLEKAGVMDMFPHTQHIEAIALFTRDRYGKSSVDK